MYLNVNDILCVYLETVSSIPRRRGAGEFGLKSHDRRLTAANLGAKWHVRHLNFLIWETRETAGVLGPGSKEIPSTTKLGESEDKSARSKNWASRIPEGRQCYLLPKPFPQRERPNEKNYLSGVGRSNCFAAIIWRDNP